MRDQDERGGGDGGEFDASAGQGGEEEVEVAVGDGLVGVGDAEGVA